LYDDNLDGDGDVDIDDACTTPTLWTDIDVGIIVKEDTDES
jgi:hypothetical protein